MCIRDSDDTVALALSQLKLPMLADTHTLSYEDRSGCLPNAIFRSNGCWQKTGENAEEFSQDDTDIVQRWSGVAKYNLYQQMRRLIACATDSACTDAQTPFESLHGTSLQDLENDGHVTTDLDMNEMVDSRRHIFPGH